MEDNNKTESQKEKSSSEDKYTLLNVWNNIPIFIKTLFFGKKIIISYCKNDLIMILYDYYVLACLLD